MFNKLKVTMMMLLKEESSSACGKNRYEYEERTDEVTENKEIERINTEIAVYEDITFWSQTCSGHLLVDLVSFGPKMFKNKDEPFALTVKPVENSSKVKRQHGFYKTIENEETIFVIIIAVLKENQISLLFPLSLLPEDRATQNKSSKKSWISNVLEA